MMQSKVSQLTIASVIFAGGLIAAAVIFSGGNSSLRSDVKNFKITMQNNQYNPSTITVNLGDKVKIDFVNRDNVSHAVEIPEFNAYLPQGHVPAGGEASMEFVANKRTKIDAAVCGGPVPTDKTDDHGEELIVNVV